MPQFHDEPGSSGTLFLIDASGFIFRAFHALPMLTSPSGVPSGAVFGFCTMVMRLLEEQRPALLAAVFDAGGPTFRHEMYPEYKANRPPPPEELVPQFPLVERAVTLFGIPGVRLAGFEADDLIATYARIGREQGLEVTILSGDKDLMQLCGDGVTLLDTMKNITYGPPEVLAKFGVPPSLLGDYLALCGDAVDNVPGVPGVGPKTATKLLGQYGGLEAVLAAAGEQKGKLRERLLEHADRARLSRRLVALRQDVPLPLPLPELGRRRLEQGGLAGFFRELGFTSLLRKVGAPDHEPLLFSTEVMDGRAPDSIAPEPTTGVDQGGEGAPIVADRAESAAEGEAQPSAAGMDTPVDRGRYITVLTIEQLDGLLREVANAGRAAFDVETTSIDPVRARLVGISLAWGPSRACYIPLRHAYLGCPTQLPTEWVLERLRPLLADESFPKYGQNAKYDWIVLRRAGLEVRGIAFDSMLASYLLDPGRMSHGLDALARDHLGHVNISFSEAAGKGGDFSLVEIRRATEYAAEDADITFRLSELLSARLAPEPELRRLFEEVELPLSRLLGRMELRGVLLDGRLLQDMSLLLERQLASIEAEVRKQAGWPINLNSPKQLQRLLFDELQLSTGRKTKTGFSTDADVLADLAALHPIVAQIEEHRTLSKLKNTYVDILPALVSPETGRVHTSYNQAVAITGRLSSSDPNLQNIPVRTEVGRRIRQAFVAPSGKRLLSADYSQVELRILAHLSGDALLLEAFRTGQDVHRRTAAEVFGVQPEAVTAEQRRVAKAVNFGVIYGQTDFGLSRQLRIPRETARQYIAWYFQRHAGVKAFMDRTIEEARAAGEVRTLLGRRRPVPDLRSSRSQDRAYAERVVRNTPIQGTAADLLKLAMLRVDRRLSEAGLDAPMILTVHDELVFEVSPEDVPVVADLVRREMEAVFPLDVPLVVDTGVGESWAEAHP